MDFFFCCVIIILLMVLAGLGVGDIAVIILALLGVLVILVGLFFAVCTVFVLMAKRQSAVFLETDEEGKYPFAFYLVGNERVKNLFPREMVMKKRFYVPEKEITILHCTRIKRVIDKNALLTIIVGALIFIPSSVFVVLIFMNVAPALT